MHHANMVCDVVAALQDTMDVPAEPEVVEAELIPAPSPPLNFYDQMANAMAAANSTQQQMFQQMQTMMETMQYMTINNGRGPSNQGGNNQKNGRWNNNNSNNGNRRYQGNRNRYQNNHDNTNNGNNNSSQNGHIVKANNQTDYCWTHGLCAHQVTT